MNTHTAKITPLKGRIPQWTFAERARKVRRDLGLTQEEMAGELGINPKRYAAWESGKNTPDDILAIATKFETISGVPRTWFLGWNDPTPIGGGTAFNGVTQIRPRPALGQKSGPNHYRVPSSDNVISGPWKNIA